MKNKILAISIIFILLSFIFINNSVFAASYDLSDYENHVGSNAYLIAYDETDKIFYLFVSANSGTKYFIGGSATVEDSKYISYGIACSGSYGSWQGNQCNYYVYTFDSSTNTFTNKTTYYPSSQFYFDNNMLIIATNTDYYHWENTTPFFQATPLPSVVYIQPLTIAEEMEKMKVQELSQTIVTTIVGLAKYLIPLLICLLGFWKAWKLLSKTLRKA